jgi:hypothetical protein
LEQPIPRIATLSLIPRAMLDSFVGLEFYALDRWKAISPL